MYRPGFRLSAWAAFDGAACRGCAAWKSPATGITAKSAANSQVCFRFCMLVPPRKLRIRDFRQNLRFQHYPGGLHASLKAISVKVEPALVTLPQNDTLTFLSRQARGGVTSFRRGPLPSARLRRGGLG